MGLKVRLIVHGIPQGQKIWGAKDEQEKKYIEIFYSDNKRDLEYMQVERDVAHDEPCVYYTFKKSGKISEVEGRSGSYIGLTLVLDKYYADIQNIYNLLQKSFEKWIVGGKILAKNRENLKYQISDFSKESDWLRKLEENIDRYIRNFSCDSDCILLNDKSQKRKNVFCEINLTECTPNTAQEAFKRDGGFKVSPQFPSKFMVAQIRKLKNEYDSKLEKSEKTASERKAKIDELENKNNSLKERLENTEKEVKSHSKAIEMENRLKQIKSLAESKEGDVSLVGLGGEQYDDNSKLPRWVIPAFAVIVLLLLVLNLIFSFMSYQRTERDAIVSDTSRVAGDHVNDVQKPGNYKDSIRIDFKKIVKAGLKH